MNGHTAPDDSDDPDGHPALPFDRKELLRLMAHELQSLGCRNAAKALVEETGIEVEAAAFSSFRTSVLAGDWDKVEKVLGSLEPRRASDSAAIRFMVYEQMFLERVEQRDIKGALDCLRSKLTPLKHNVKRLHQLSGLVMCADKDELYAEANWLGGVASRKQMLTAIQDHISTSMLVPQGRLVTLLEQALELQKRDCLYHNSNATNTSLLEDHHCSRDVVPLHVRAILADHTDEVWFVRFSHSGAMLASASKDNTACIWDMATLTVKHVLRGHLDELSYVAWSPDDTRLLTCGGDNDRTVCMWDTGTGDCILTIERHTEGVTACAWTPCGTKFVTGSTDNTLRLWSDKGTLLHTWERVRATDLAIASDGQLLVVVCHEHKLRVFDMASKKQRFAQESSSITSLALSEDGNHALLNLGSQELHLWNIHTLQIVGKYKGHKQGRYSIRSCFGGSNETFVASGSEDHKVYLWHRQTEKLLEVLEGHKAVVNSVAWHPRDACMFASASDDHTVRVWSTQPAEENSDGSLRGGEVTLANGRNHNHAAFHGDGDGDGSDDVYDEDEDGLLQATTTSFV